MDIKDACKIAINQLEHCHNPYSKFSVGASLHATDGKVFGGCNIENASYGGTVCAERVAIFKAASEGYREFDYIVIATETKKPAPPCAFCLQVITEFCSGDFQIHLANRGGIVKSYRLDELLPHPFDPSWLDADKEKA
ncbi:MAG: cytidine deaminase [Candidatus Cloacimonadota bacterium]|nr:MAG: cytidine deaminase [Candidatus Cloacimonadota bacterium]